MKVRWEKCCVFLLPLESKARLSLASDLFRVAGCFFFFSWFFVFIGGGDFYSIPVFCKAASRRMRFALHVTVMSSAFFNPSFAFSSHFDTGKGHTSDADVCAFV